MNESFEFDFEQWGGLRDTLPISDLSVDFLRDGVFAIEFNSGLIYVKFTNLRFLQNSDSILFCLNAATSNRADKNPPFFSGERLSNSMNRTLISISDNATHNPKVDLGWYIGDEQWLNYQRDLCGMIDKIAEILDKSIVIFGGSGGGFASIALSLSLSNSATIVAMNPQLDIFHYPTAPIFLKEAFPNSGISVDAELVKNDNSWREFFVANRLDGVIGKSQLNSKCDYVLLQNWNDSHHLNHHTPNLIREINNLNLSNFFGTSDNLSFLFGPWGDRHSVVWMEHIILTLNDALDGKSHEEIVTNLSRQFLSTGSYSESDSNLLIPPCFEFNGIEDKLNLVRPDFKKFIQKHETLDSILSGEFLQPLIEKNSDSLNVFAILSYLESWLKYSIGNDLDQNFSLMNASTRYQLLRYITREMEKRKALKLKINVVRDLIKFNIDGLDGQDKSEKLIASYEQLLSFIQSIEDRD